MGLCFCNANCQKRYRVTARNVQIRFSLVTQTFFFSESRCRKIRISSVAQIGKSSVEKVPISVVFLVFRKFRHLEVPISTNSHFYAKNLPPQTKVLFWGNCLTGQSVSERNCRNATKFGKFRFFATNTKLLNISNANFKTFTPVPETKQETLFGHSSHQISVFRKLCKLLN